MPADLDPALAPADQLVGGALAEQPAVDASDLHRDPRRAARCCGTARRRRCRTRCPRARSAACASARRSRCAAADAEVVHVRSQAAGEADVVLTAVVADADEPVEDVVVLVQPHVGGQADVAVDVAQADVVAVVPLRIAPGDAGERVGDLVQRVFVEPDEHGRLLSTCRMRLMERWRNGHRSRTLVVLALKKRGVDGRRRVRPARWRW